MCTLKKQKHLYIAFKVGMVVSHGGVLTTAVWQFYPSYIFNCCQWKLGTLSLHFPCTLFYSPYNCRATSEKNFIHLDPAYTTPGLLWGNTTYLEYKSFGASIINHASIASFIASVIKFLSLLGFLLTTILCQ